MKKHKLVRKLKLHRETIRSLDAQNLKNVVGGAYSEGDTCQAPSGSGCRCTGSCTCRV